MGCWCSNLLGTCYRKRARRTTIKCCLDRADENEYCHNNRPISYKTNEEVKKKIFDKKWLYNEELKQIIFEGWKYSDLPPDTNIMEYISSCRRALNQWRRKYNLNS